MKPMFLEQEADDLAKRRSAVAVTARSWFDDQCVYPCDPAAAVVRLPAPEAHPPASLVLHDQHALILGAGLNPL